MLRARMRLVLKACSSTRCSPMPEITCDPGAGQSRARGVDGAQHLDLLEGMKPAGTRNEASATALVPAPQASVVHGPDLVSVPYRRTSAAQYLPEEAHMRVVRR